MPSNEIFYDSSPVCVSNNSYTITDCPPIKTSCIPMDLTCLWIALQEDGYNCVKCGADTPFCVPYVQGDLIHLQTQLPDIASANSSQPNAGWFPTTVPAGFRAQLLDASGAVISSDVTTFTSEYMAAFSEFEGGFNYQTLIIDTQLIFNNHALTCWQIRVNSFESDGATENRVVYTEGFCEIKCEEETTLVNGEWDTVDCCGNYYGEPGRIGTAWVGSSVILFDNTMRYQARVINTGSNIEKETFSQRVTKSTNDTLYILSLNAPIAPFMKNIFASQHYSAKVVTIDGIEYIAAGTIDNRISDKSGSMFLFDVDLQLRCENNFNCD